METIQTGSVCEPLGALASRQFVALCDANGFGGETAAAASVMSNLVASWTDWPRSRPPRWSGFSDDCTPYEVSTVLGGKRPEVRIGFEAQHGAATVDAYWRAGTELNEFLEATHGADLGAFRRVEDLYRPSDPDAYYAMWHGACFWPGRAPAFKLYLNPRARGRDVAPATLRETFERLGFPDAIPSIERVMDAGRDEFLSFALDLSSDLGNRAKVYLRLRQASRRHLETLIALAQDGDPRGASEFAAALTGRTDVFDRRPLQMSFTFVDSAGRGARPDRATLLVPPVMYSPNDAVVRDRVRAVLVDYGVDTSLYDRSAEAVVPGAAARERGAHGYVSLQWEAERPRVTVYFSGRAFRDAYGDVDPRRPWPSPHAGYRAA